MGEISDMMIDGTLCEACGGFIGEGPGYPQYCCEECARDRGASLHLVKEPMTESEIKRHNKKIRRNNGNNKTRTN